MILPYFEWDLIAMMSLAMAILGYIIHCYVEVATELRAEIVKLKKQAGNYPKIHPTSKEEWNEEKHSLLASLDQLQLENNELQVQLQVQTTKYRMVKAELEDLQERTSLDETDGQSHGCSSPSEMKEEIKVEELKMVFGASPSPTQKKGSVKDTILEKMKATLSELENTKAQLAEKTKEIADLKKSGGNMSPGLSGTEEITRLKMELLHSTKKIEEKELEIRVMKNSATERTKKIDALSKELRDANFENHDLMSKVRDAEKKFGVKEPEDTARLRKNIEDLKKKLSEKNQDAAKTAEVLRELDSTKLRLSQAQEETETLRRELATMSGRDETDGQLELRSKISAMKRDISDKDELLEKARNEATFLRETIRNQKDQIHHITNQLDESKRLIALHEEEMGKLRSKEMERVKDNGIIESLMAQIDKLEKEHELLQQRLAAANTNIDPDGQTAHMQNKIDYLEMENEDLQKNIAMLQRQISSQPVEEEITVSESPQVQMTQPDELLRHSSPSNTLEHQTNDVIKTLEEKVQQLTQINSDMETQFADEINAIEKEVIGQLANIFSSFGGDKAKIVGKTFPEAVEVIDSILRFKMRKKDDMLRDLDAENETLTRRMHGLQEQIEKSKDLENELGACKTNLIKMMTFVGFDSLDDSKSAAKISEESCRAVIDEIDQLRNAQVAEQQEPELEQLHYQLQEITNVVKEREAEISFLKSQNHTNPSNEDQDSMMKNIEAQHAKGTVTSILEANGISYEPENDLSSLVSLLYDQLCQELNFQRDHLTEESNRVRELKRRLEDDDALLEDATTCRNILRQILSKNEVTYQNAENLEELVMRVKKVIERLKNPPPIQAEGRRSRSLTKLLKGTNLMKKSKSKENLRGSQMSLASSTFMSSAESRDNLTSDSGLLTDLSNFSKLSTEQLRASLENMQDNDPGKDHDEVKVNLFEILKTLERAPEYPKPSLEMVKMIRDEIEVKKIEDQREKERLRAEEMNLKKEEPKHQTDEFADSFAETYNQVHQNLYSLLHNAGFSPDPTAGALQLSETANEIVLEKLNSLRRISIENEQENQNLQHDNYEMKDRIHELESRIREVSSQPKETTFGAEPDESFEMREKEAKINELTAEVEYLIVELEKSRNIIEKENAKSSESSNDLEKVLHENATLSNRLQEKNDAIRSKDIELDELEKMLKEKQNEMDRLKETIIELENKPQRDFDSDTDKNSLKKRIKSLESENQQINTMKIQKESELQEQVLGLIDQNTKLIENKKQLRNEIKTLKQTLKESGDNSGSALRAKIRSLEEELQTMREQHFEAGSSAGIEQALEEERQRSRALQEKVRQLQQSSPGANQSTNERVENLSRNLATANAKLTGQAEMVKRWQQELAESSKEKEQIKELQLENQLLMRKLSDNDAEDLTSIRYAFVRLCEDLEIKTPPDDLPLAEQMENVYEIIKKRNKGVSNKKVRFNPNLSSVSVQNLDEAHNKRNFPTWPKGEEGASGPESLPDERMESIQHELWVKEQTIHTLTLQLQQYEVKGESPKSDLGKNSILQILNMVESPQDFRLKNKDGIDNATLLKRLERSVEEILTRKDNELMKLGEANKDLSRKCNQLEQDVDSLVQSSETVRPGASMFSSRSTSDLDRY